MMGQAQADGLNDGGVIRAGIKNAAQNGTGSLEHCSSMSFWQISEWPTRKAAETALSEAISFSNILPVNSAHWHKQHH